MAQLQKKWLAANAVDETKIRLSNNANLRARNAANSGDVSILKVNASDRIEFASVPQSTSDASAANDLPRYSQLTSATGVSGSDIIGDDNTYSNFTPSAATVKGALAGIDAALAGVGGSTFSDAMFRVYDDGDNTKQIALEASGIATATTRTITMPDSDVDLGKVATAIQRDGSVAFTANQPMGTHKLTGLSAGSGSGDSVRYEQAILVSGANAFAADQSFGGFKATNLADPVSNQDAVTLAYMNARLAGIKPKAAVRVATTVAGTLATSFENGDTIDGVTLATGDRILIKDQAAPAANGIYTVNASGAPTRATDYDSLSPIDEINGAWVAVQEGTANAGKIYVQFGTVATLGTDAINFEYFNPIAGLIGGDMITFSGSTFSVDLATASGLESSNPGNVAGQLRIKLEASNPSLKFTGSNELAAKLDAAGAIASGASGLAVQVDGSTIEINTNALRVKDAGITLAKLASNSVDENKIVSTSFNAAGAITGGSGTKIAVQVDGSTIEISSNALRVKDAGITLAKLASNSVDENKIVSTAISTTGALNGGGGTKLSVRVDAVTSKINGSNNIESLKGNQEFITLSGTDITNQYVDLAHAIYGTSATVNSASLSPVGGPEQLKGTDYTVSLIGGSGGVTRITFAGDLATGGLAALVAADILMIQYDYL